MVTSATTCCSTAATSAVRRSDRCRGEVELERALHEQLLADHLVQHPEALGQRRLPERLAGLDLGLGDEIGAQDRPLVDERDVLGRHHMGGRALGGEQANPRDAEPDSGADRKADDRARRVDAPKVQNPIQSSDRPFRRPGVVARGLENGHRVHPPDRAGAADDCARSAAGPL